MPIVNKDVRLMEIAGSIGKGSLSFDSPDRPSVVIGGRDLFVGSVSYDYHLGELVFSAVDSSGRELPTSAGVRRLEELDVKTLNEVAKTVRMYSGFRQSRAQNMYELESQVLQAGRGEARRLMGRL